jgi:hypothetical protein
MKRISEFINEKLKVSSHNIIPSIDAFIKEFGKYINKTERAFSFKNLESCKDYNSNEPETFINILPSYEFTHDEEFLTLPGNRYFVIPKGTVYIYSIDMFKDNTQNLADYYFTLYYLDKDGLNSNNFQQRRNFDIFKDDLIEIIGEDKYLELYDYLERYEKN